MSTGDILATALHALLKLLVAGIVLGTGLPALFALGIRALNTNHTVVVAVTASNRENSRSSLLPSVATICFGLCLLAVLVGIAVICSASEYSGLSTIGWGADFPKPAGSTVLVEIEERVGARFASGLGDVWQGGAGDQPDGRQPDSDERPLQDAEGDHTE